MDHKEGVVPVAVEGKEGATWPFMTGSPEHRSAISHIEGIGGVHLQNAKLWVIGMFLPDFVSRVDAALDASFKATAELIGATGGGGFFTSDLDHSFGHEAAPDLTNSNGSSASIGFAEG